MNQKYYAEQKKRDKNMNFFRFKTFVLLGLFVSISKKSIQKEVVNEVKAESALE